MFVLTCLQHSQDEALVNEMIFEEFWHRNVEESIRQGNIAPFVEESVLQVSDWGFKLADFQVQRKCQNKGFVDWLKSIYNQAECKLTGYLGPIHIWQVSVFVSPGCPRIGPLELLF